MFQGSCIDDLTIEQYHMLILLLNKRAEESLKASKHSKFSNFTTVIQSIDGKEGVDYGDD